MNKKLLYLVALGGLLSLGVQAQVTLGSGLKPNAGALLDLKEYDDTTAKTGGRTAEKGLGLPRVKLTSMNTLDDIDGATGTGYEGLIVYNVSKLGGMCPGIHVWDGSNWVGLGDANAKHDIAMIDGDGNSYNGRWFSLDPCDPTSPGDYWTTSNIYSTQKAGGGSFDQGTDIDNTPRFNPAYTNGHNAIPIGVNGLSTSTTVKYGETTVASSSGVWNMNDNQQVFARKFGLLYTHHQATQLCPTSWHLPSEAEWDKLTNSLGGVTIAGGNMRKRPGIAGRFYYFRNAENQEYKWGLDAENGVDLPGFDATPSGFIAEDGTNTRQIFYYTYWWTADAPNQARLLMRENSELHSYTLGTGKYFSVRCVKD